MTYWSGRKCAIPRSCLALPLTSDTRGRQGLLPSSWSRLLSSLSRFGGLLFLNQRINGVLQASFTDSKTARRVVYLMSRKESARRMEEEGARACYTEEMMSSMHPQPANRDVPWFGYGFNLVYCLLVLESCLAAKGAVDWLAKSVWWQRCPADAWRKGPRLSRARRRSLPCGIRVPILGGPGCVFALLTSSVQMRDVPVARRGEKGLGC